MVFQKKTFWAKRLNLQWGRLINWSKFWGKGVIFTCCQINILGLICRLRHHYTTGNTKAFFQMYKSEFLLTRNLIEMFIHRIRIIALRIISKRYHFWWEEKYWRGIIVSFGEKISAQYLSELLGFDGVEKFVDFITASSI